MFYLQRKEQIAFPNNVPLIQQTIYVLKLEGEVILECVVWAMCQAILSFLLFLFSRKQAMLSLLDIPINTSPHARRGHG